MKQRLSKLRKAQIGLLVLLAILILGFMSSVTWLLIDRSIQIADVKARISSLEVRRLEMKPADAATNSVPPVALAESGLLEAMTEAEAYKRLDSYLRSVFQGKGASDVLIQAASSAQEEGVPVLRATVNVRLPESELLKAIYILEAGTPAIFVDSVRLEPLKRTALDEDDGSWIALAGSIHVYLSLTPEVSK